MTLDQEQAVHARDRRSTPARENEPCCPISYDPRPLERPGRTEDDATTGSSAEAGCCGS